MKVHRLDLVGSRSPAKEGVTGMLFTGLRDGLGVVSLDRAVHVESP